MTALISYFLLALLVSFLCSLMEATFLSVSRAHVGVLLKRGYRSGVFLKNQKSKVDQPLSAILTLNTIANTVGAAGVGAQALKVFGSEWVAAASAVLTFSILVFSEIVPKTLGAVYWKKLSRPAAYIIQFLIIITYPFVVMLKGISILITRNRRQTFLTREELLTLAQIGETEGILLKKETRIIENLFRLNRIYAADVLTPRSVILAFQKDQTVEEIVNTHNPIRFSQIPIYDRDIDNILGMVFRSKIMEMYFKGQKKKTMEELVIPLYVVPQTKSIARILDEFIKRKEQIFLVVDEYGGTEGIITLEDVIETLLGVEIVDELDTEEDMRKLARKQWRERLQKRGHMNDTSFEDEDISGGIE
jgi:CBS domain containing-hemolysin-like protein